MSNIIRHCGVVRSTGSRVYVLWRQLENDPQHCLVVYRDSLPEVYAHPVERTIMGVGQSGVELWDIMDKAGHLEGYPMLTALHKNGYIRKQNTADIDMHIGGNRKICLLDLNAEIAASQQPVEQKDGSVKDFNPFDAVPHDNFPEKAGIVNRLLNEAVELEKRALENRERAYSLDPTTRPAAATNAEGKRTFTIELVEGVSQAKAIEQVKKIIKERKASE